MRPRATMPMKVNAVKATACRATQKRWALSNAVVCGKAAGSKLPKETMSEKSAVQGDPVWEA